MTSEVLCPQIAEEHIIVTLENLNSLVLTNYERTVGTEVKVSCISPTSHRLNGSEVLRCLSSGQWDNPIPSCVPKSTDDNDVTGNDGGALVKSNVYELLPYIIALAILGITCIFLIIILGKLLRIIQRYRANAGSYLLESSDDYIPSTSENGSRTDNWVEMASSRNFWCHELARSHDNENPIESLKYTRRYSHWSGY